MFETVFLISGNSSWFGELVNRDHHILYPQTDVHFSEARYSARTVLEVDHEAAARFVFLALSASHAWKV